MKGRLEVEILDGHKENGLKLTRKILPRLCYFFIISLTLTFSALASPAISDDMPSPFPLPKSRVCENQNCLGLHSELLDCREKNNVYGFSANFWNHPLCAGMVANLNTNNYYECTEKKIGLKPEQTCDWSSLENCATDELIAHNEEHGIVSIFYTHDLSTNSGTKNILLDHIETLNASGEPIYHIWQTSGDLRGIRIDLYASDSIRRAFVDIQETVVNPLHPNIRSARFHHASPFLDRNIIYRFDYKQCNSCTALDQSIKHDAPAFIGKMQVQRPLRCPGVATFELPTNIIDVDLARVANSHPSPFVIPVERIRELHNPTICSGHKDINFRIEDSEGTRKYFVDRISFVATNTSYHVSLQVMRNYTWAPWTDDGYDYSSLPMTNTTWRENVCFPTFEDGTVNHFECLRRKFYGSFQHSNSDHFRFPLNERVLLNPQDGRPPLFIQFD